MGVTLETKEEFSLALKEELGIQMTRSESDQLLADVVGYFKLLASLERRVETPQKPQN